MISEACRRGWNRGAQKRSKDPLWRRNTTEANRKRSQDPISRENHAAAMKKMHRDPEYQRNHREAMQRVAQDPEWQRKMQGVLQDPEWRRKNAEALQKTHQDLERQRKHREALQKLHQDPEFRRKHHEALKKISLDPEWQRKMHERRGENHPLWNGGSSFWPYCHLFNEEFKEETRQKFGNICFVCGAPPNGTALHVHHIHYDKGAGCNGRGLECVPLCGSHNTKANFHREWWVAYFEQRLRNVFGWHLDVIPEDVLASTKTNGGA